MNGGGYVDAIIEGGHMVFAEAFEHRPESEVANCVVVGNEDLSLLEGRLLFAFVGRK
jgi:hypothetical protein